MGYDYDLDYVKAPLPHMFWVDIGLRLAPTESTPTTSQYYVIPISARTSLRTCILLDPRGIDIWKCRESCSFRLVVQLNAVNSF